MSLTTFQKILKPEEREALLEVFLQSRFEDLGAIFGNAYIEGLRLEWLSGTGVRVKTGAADLPDGGRRLRVTADIDKTGLSLSAGAWYHLYLYNNAGSAAVEVVTTAPVSYFGSAYQKTGDATRRYLGSVRTDASGNILNFIHQLPNFIRYRSPHNVAPLLILSGGTATTETAVNCSGAVPQTSRLVHALLSHAGTAGVLYVGTSDDSTAPPASGVASLSAGHEDTLNLPLDSSQQMTYAFSAAPGGSGGFIVVHGYWFDR